MLGSAVRIFQKNQFQTKAAQPRKCMSRAPNQLSAANLAREYGSPFQTIDARIGDLKFVLNPGQGIWQTEESSISADEMAALEKQKLELEHENDILRAKIDMLLELLAQVTAEAEFRMNNKSETSASDNTFTDDQI